MVKAKLLRKDPIFYRGKKIKKGETFEINEVECNRCGACAAVCKFDAVKVA